MANIESVRLPDGSEFDIVDAITPRTAASQPNLLINPWFTVNQRGATSGSVGTTATYIIDRWRGIRLGSYSISSNGLSLAWDGVHGTFGYLRQDIEGGELKGREVTFSAIIDGNIIEKSFTVPLSGEATYSIDTIWELNVGIANSPDAVIIALRTYTTTSHTIRAMKLEIGATSTLHLDTAPDYSTELLKCQRYFVRKSADATYRVFGLVSTDSSTAAGWALLLAVPLRTNPSISYGGSFYIRANGQNYTVTAISTGANQVSAQVQITLTSSGLPVGVLAMLANDSASAYIDINAEL